MGTHRVYILIAAGIIAGFFLFRSHTEPKSASGRTLLWGIIAIMVFSDWSFRSEQGYGYEDVVMCKIKPNGKFCRKLFPQHKQSKKTVLKQSTVNEEQVLTKPVITHKRPTIASQERREKAIEKGKKIQAQLKRLGLFSGSIDGKTGGDETSIGIYMYRAALSIEKWQMDYDTLPTTLSKVNKNQIDPSSMTTNFELKNLRIIGSADYKLDTKVLSVTFEGLTGDLLWSELSCDFYFHPSESSHVLPIRRRSLKLSNPVSRYNKSATMTVKPVKDGQPVKSLASCVLMK